MKKYRLLASLGTSKIGDVLETDENGWAFYKYIDGVSMPGIELAPHDIAIMLHCKMLEEIVEEHKHGCKMVGGVTYHINCTLCCTCKQPAEWKPEEGSTYNFYYFNGEGVVFKKQWEDDEADNGRLAFGNCFATEALAQQALEALRVTLKGLRKK